MRSAMAHDRNGNPIQWKQQRPAFIHNFKVQIWHFEIALWANPCHQKKVADFARSASGFRTDSGGTSGVVVRCIQKHAFERKQAVYYNLSGKFFLATTVFFCTWCSPVHPPAPDADGHEADERVPAMMNIAMPSARERYIPPSPAAMLPKSTASTMASASLMFFADCSIKTVFVILHLTLCFSSRRWR